MLRPSALAVLTAVSLAATAWSGRARADEEWLGETPGRHRTYKLELEPHADFALGGGRDVTGFGLGARVGIPLVENGFIKTLNNSVALSTGLDWISYSGCYSLQFGDCSSITALWLPVTMQWNFYLTPSWTVFGELGASVRRVSYGDNCGGTAGSFADGSDAQQECGTSATTKLRPSLWLGGRYHLTESQAITARIGTDYFTAGASFFF